jgi:hypothetical protein
MQYFILGLAALVIALFVMRGLASANPAQLARQLRMAGGLAALGGAGLLVVRGTTNYALPLAALGLWLLAGGSLGAIGGARRKSPGQTSRVVTDFLDMELDHDSGDMRGKVLRGMFAGRTLASLKPVELALLWQDCRLADPGSAQLVEAYLDRVHPTWREDVARGEARMSGGPDGRMSAEEAREILGVGPDADEDAIRRAHRELILKLHPDRGGSTYLAAKVNEAKDVLLGGR